MGYRYGMETRSAFGPFVLDRERQKLLRNGEALPVGLRGYLLLETLLDAGGEPVSKRSLMERAWPGTIIEEGNLTVQISALRRQLGEGADAVIVTVPRIGYRLVAKAAEQLVVDRGGPPLIAVLPFANFGSTAEDGHFVDGVVDDIITSLSRFKTFAVISRGASFALRDKGVGARAAASELGVRYALEGSVRRMGDQLRITAQLLDAASGAQLWGERYDGGAADIFSFLDRITESVVGRIEPTIRLAEIERSRRKPAANLDAYDLFLRAAPLVDGPGADRHEEAMGLLRQAAALDPGFALARTYAALLYEKRISVRLPPIGEDARETCIADAQAALALGGSDPLVRAICGWVLFVVTRDKSALDGLRQAVAENPNNVVILSLAGTGNRISGALEEAYACYRRAYELSPGAPEAYRFIHGLGAVEMIRGNYELAIEWCLKSLATFNDWFFSHVTLVASYVNLGRMEEAAAMISRIRKLNPDLTIERIVNGAAPGDPYAAAVIPCLRKAGLPER